MRVGWVISILLHGGIVGAGLFMVPYESDRDRDLQRVTTVSLVESPVLQQGPETAPQPSDVAPEVLDLSFGDMAAPQFNADAGPPPADDIAPVATIQDFVEDPSERDAAANLTALLEEVAQPDVVMDVNASFETSADPAPQMPTMALPGVSGFDTSTSTPRGPSLGRPAPPRPGGGLAAFTPPPPPTPDRRPEPEPEPEPEEEPPVEEDVATPEGEEVEVETAAQDDPAGEEEATSNALRRSTAPARRPRDFEAQVLATRRLFLTGPESGESEAQETAAAAPEDTPEDQAEDPPEDQQQAAVQTDRTVTDAVTSSGDPLAPPTPPQAAPLPVGPPLTAGEKDQLRLAVGRCWNPPTLVANAANLRVVLAAELDPKGRIFGGTIRLIEPTNADRPEIQAAFQAARRALLRCGGGGYDLPPEKYAQWKNLEVAFDPKGMLSRW